MTQSGPRRAVVLDSAALSALAGWQGRETMVRLKVALEQALPVVFPTVILAEVLTGSPSDAAVWRVVSQITPVDLTLPLAAAAGGRRQRAEAVRKKKRDLTVDALVAATAIACAPSLLVTADSGDLGLLTAGADVKVVPV